MIRKIKNNILFLCPLLMLASCVDNDLDGNHTLSGEGKIPLEVTALLDVNSQVSKTRAANKDFANGDQLLAYIRHVTWGIGNSDEEKAERTLVSADNSPKLITFTKGSETMTAYSGGEITPIGTGVALGLTSTNTNQTSDLTNDLSGGKIYWDDFSDASSPDTDLHTAHHYIQSYYGYCYNGGSPTETLEVGTNKQDGRIKWSVSTDQSTPEAFQHSDLLWSAEQTPVIYDHASAREDDNRAGLILPYTHAMSKVTINVIAGDGFANDYGFSETGVVLDKVRIKCTATAPTSTLTYPGKDDDTAKADVTMQPGTGTGTRSFQAIIVPSILTVGNTFATITKMDGNTYSIPVTEAMVDATNGWGSQLTAAEEDVNNGTAQARPTTRASYDNQIPGGKGHEMKSGVHYLLNVTVNKTEVTVSAVILDWTEVTAEGDGEIFFEHDVKDEEDGSIDEALKANGFDIYKKSEYNDDFGTKATSLRWNRTSEKWRYNPTIYWQGHVNEYFRALSNVKTDALGTPENESLVMENGRDALWGTTKEHSGKYEDNIPYTYPEGAALAPRTGTVPLMFYHAMAKITINLEDYSRNSSDASSRLDLHGATIQLTNLATGGTIELDKGMINPSSKEDKTFSEDRGAIPSRMGFFAAKENDAVTTYNEKVTVRDYFITPQTIGEDASLIVTLANGTTYKTKLNLCKLTGSNTTVDAWERGKHYVYTITLAKDEIMFRAEIKDWDNVEVSGIITPEW